MQAGPSATADDAREAFVSHSTKDREVAEWVSSQLETHGITVWIAPRDVRPGRNYAEEIIHAIETTRLTIVVLSDNANASVHVQHEVERAVSKGKPVFPVRVADVAPARALELFVSAAQWIDLFGPARDAGINRLVRAAKDTLGQPVENLPRIVSTSVHIPAPAAAPRRSGMPLVAGAALVVALAAGGVAWQRGIFGSGPTLDLDLTGAPAAEVHLDGKFVGTVSSGKPKRIPIVAGPHAIKVEAAGYWPYEKNFEVGDGGEPLAVTLAKRSTLMVTVATSGAKIAVNGEVVTKPFPLELPDGQYTVDVTADGYEAHREVVALAGGERQTVTVSLTAVKKVEPPPPAAPRVVRPRDDDDRGERRARRDDGPHDSSSFNPGRQAAEQPHQGGGTNIIINPGGMPGPGRLPGFGFPRR